MVTSECGYPAREMMFCYTHFMNRGVIPFIDNGDRRDRRHHGDIMHARYRMAEQITVVLFAVLSGTFIAICLIELAATDGLNSHLSLVHVVHFPDDIQCIGPFAAGLGFSLEQLVNW